MVNSFDATTYNHFLWMELGHSLSNHNRIHLLVQVYRSCQGDQKPSSPRCTLSGDDGLDEVLGKHGDLANCYIYKCIVCSRYITRHSRFLGQLCLVIRLILYQEVFHTIMFVVPGGSSSRRRRCRLFIPKKMMYPKILIQLIVDRTSHETKRQA